MILASAKALEEALEAPIGEAAFASSMLSAVHASMATSANIL